MSKRICEWEWCNNELEPSRPKLTKHCLETECIKRGARYRRDKYAKKKYHDMLEQKEKEMLEKKG